MQGIEQLTNIMTEGGRSDVPWYGCWPWELLKEYRYDGTARYAMINRTSTKPC